MAIRGRIDHSSQVIRTGSHQCPDSSCLARQYIKRLDAKVSNRFLFAWGLNLPASFPCNHCQASVRPAVLIRDPVQRVHQFGTPRHPVIRGHPRANMRKDVDNRLLPYLSLAQSHSHGMV